MNTVLLSLMLCASYPFINVTPPGWELSRGYSARTGKVMDAETGLIPVLVGPISYAPGTDTIYCALVDYTNHVSTLVQLPGLDVTHTPTGGGVVLRGTNLWVNVDLSPCFGADSFGTTGAWVIQHYGLADGAATLLETVNYPLIGCSSINQSQVALIDTPAGGVLGQFQLPNPFTGFPAARTLGAIYRTPTGNWTWELLSPTYSQDINQEDVRTSFATHPADGSVWAFSVEPGSYSIRSTRYAESGGDYSYAINTNWIPRYSLLCNQYESPPICTLQDPWNRSLVLMYGSYRLDMYATNDTPYPGRTWSPATIVDVKTDGTYSGVYNTNCYVGSLLTGMAGMINGPDLRTFVYRDMTNSRSLGGFAMSEGLVTTNCTLSVVTVENGVWTQPEYFADARLFISYVQNIPGVLIQSYPEDQVRFYYPLSPPPPVTVQPPPVVQSLQVALSVGSYFTARSAIPYTVTCTSSGARVSGVTVRTTLAGPKRSATQTLTSGAGGVARGSFQLNKSWGTGSYRLSVTASKSGYTDSTTSTYLTVR